MRGVEGPGMTPGVWGSTAGDILGTSSAFNPAGIEGLGDGAETETLRAASRAGCRTAPLMGGPTADNSTDCAVCGAGESTELVRPPT